MVTQISNSRNISVSHHFNKLDLAFSKSYHFDVVTMKGLELSSQVGAPQLPFQIIHLAIPVDERVDHIEMTAVEPELLTGNYSILPAIRPEILSAHSKNSSAIDVPTPNARIYASEAAFPAQVIELAGEARLGAIKLVALRVYPLQYHPAEQKLFFYSDILFQVIATQESYHQTQNAISETEFSAILASKLVKNMAGSLLMKKPLAKDEASESTPKYEYLIITSSSLESNFKPLLDWKTKKGVPATIVTTEYIYAKFAGSDRQEQIRNFIRQAVKLWGVYWVLLGGDVNIIPARTAFAMDCKFGGDRRENEIPCDLYYADLDGSWNDDGDQIFGEIADEINMIPEVIVGRAPVEDAAEAKVFVDKVLTYEKNPPQGYLRKMLFAAEILWANPYTNTGIGKDMIEQAYLPPNFYEITKLYEDLGNESIATVRTAIDAGQHIINHHGHASANVMGMGDGYFRRADMQTLTNGTMQGILYSIGCYPANFEVDCIAEDYVNNPNGGGVAFIGNSRYGWGSPGNPGYGYSDRFDFQFFRFLFKERVHNLGLALALAKAYYVPFARQENVYRWCMYEINLLGDPEMPVWTDAPSHLNVQAPARVNIGNSVIPVTVTHRSSPLEEALVCLRQAETIYEYGRTDAAGQIQFAISVTDASKPIELTVTASNFLPVEKTIAVQSSAPYVICSDLGIDDRTGNGDGLINPGETVHLKLRLKNLGAADANQVTVTVTSTDSFITMIDPSAIAGSIAANDSTECMDVLILAVDRQCPNGYVLHLNAQILAESGLAWNQTLALTNAAPVISLSHQEINDREWGNGNSIPEPGEKFRLTIGVVNNGLASAHNVRSTLTTTDPQIQIDPKISAWGTIAPGQMAVDSFIVQALQPPIPSFPDFRLNITTEEGFLFSPLFHLTIGATGFQDDLEHGTGGWYRPNAMSNHWHLSTQNPYSGGYSWYCGDEATGNYLPHDDATLESPAFYLGHNSRLTFWAWFNVAIYGVNGFYVDVFDGLKWRKLDFIGSGGALDSVLMGNDWLPYNYDLSDIAAGTLSRVRFRWVSDDEPLPPGKITGVFIDNIEISSQPIVTMEPGGHIMLPVPTEYKLAQNYPNPFNRWTRIDYQIAGESFQQVTLDIFNLNGQKVRTLIAGLQAKGYYTAFWDGTGDKGEPVASGVYFYQLRVSDLNLQKKLLLIR
ncbi:MAG: C25 family cysteine peptidase [candidate division KSB1 bacterium]|nr:C25 family cysteine peptidase [candidate division KSB1 bacterium]